MNTSSPRESMAHPIDEEKGLGSTPIPIARTPTDSGASTPHSTKEPRNLNLPLQIPNHEPRSLSSKIFHFITDKSNPTNILDTSLPPDGGFFPWLVVFFTFMTGFNTFGLLNAYGVFQSHYTTSLSLPPSTISWIGSLEAFLLMFVGAVCGRLTDAGYFHQVFFLGTLLLLLGLFTLAQSTTYYQVLLSHGICVGMGGGMCFTPAMTLVSTYFSKHRAMALAIVAIGNSLGGLVFAAILQNLLPSVGFAWAVRTIGFVVCATMIPANFILKPRRILRPKGRKLIEWGAFGESIYCCFAAGMFFSMVGQWVPVFYLGSFGRDIIHIPTKSASSLILIINGVGVVGRVLPALFASKLGPLNLMIPLSLLSGIILLAWAGVNDYTGALVFDVFYGTIMAAAQGMFAPSLGSLTEDLSKMGTRMGMVFSICGCALLVGNPVAGALITVDGGKYLYTQMFAGVAFLIGVGFLTAARVLKMGWKLNVRV